MKRLSKAELIALVHKYNDEAPREILRSMSVKELLDYVEVLKKAQDGV